MSGQSKFLPQSSIILGIICLIWIIYDIISIYTNLESVTFLGMAGVIAGIGYLFIFVFHILIIIVYFRYFLKSHNHSSRVGIPVLFVLSVLALFMEKVMFDEVAREYYLEFPMPGETHFIVFGLLINGIFIVYSIFNVFKRVGVSSVKYKG